MPSNNAHAQVSRVPILLATVVAFALAIVAAFAVVHLRSGPPGADSTRVSGIDDLEPEQILATWTPRSSASGHAGAGAAPRSASGLRNDTIRLNPDDRHLLANGLTLATEGAIAPAVAEQLYPQLIEWLGPERVKTGPMPEPGAAVSSPMLGIVANANVQWTPTSARGLVIVTWIAVDAPLPVPWPDVAAYSRERGGTPLEWINNPAVRGALFALIAFDDEVDTAMTPEEYRDRLAAMVAERVMNELRADGANVPPTP